MSKYTYAGDFQNPTQDWIVKPVGKKFGIFIRSTKRREDGSIPADRRHSSAKLFSDEEDAHEYILGMNEFFEEDYDQYLDENHEEIARMERYEAFRNEY